MELRGNNMHLSATLRAVSFLSRGAVVLTLGGLLLACAEADDTAGEDASGEGAGGAGIVEGAGGAGVPDPGAGGDAWTGAGGDAWTGAGGDIWAGAGGATGAGGLGDPWAAGGSGAGGAGLPPGTGGVPPVGVQCNPVLAGVSSVVVDGVPRTFSVQMPLDTSRMALLFLWHGYLQAPDEFANKIVYDVGARTWVPFDPNAFPMPLMIVTPHDLKLFVPTGLDWDIGSGAKDFPYFEAMQHCIQQQYSIDTTRIYSFGFSAGAVFTNLLSAKYPNLFAATISESGAWFNDQTQWSDVLIPGIPWQWPAFNPADRGNVLLTHGGSGDFATIISLESANQKALPYLYNNGRTVTDCSHTFGHTLAPDLTQRNYYDFLWAHQLGSPPVSGLVPGFPTPENPVGATRCTFRPAP